MASDTPGQRLVTWRGNWQATRDGFDWDIPARFNIARACCDGWAAIDPDRVALIDAGAGDRDWTYGALKDASDRLATVFARAGVGRGDRVAVLLPQGPAVLIAHFAALKLGAIVLPLFSLFGADALRFRLADSGAVLAVTDTDGAEKLSALRADLPDLRGVQSIDGDFWAQIAAAPPLEQPVDTAADDPAVMIYTSGTTGNPKGALHAHRFLLGHLPSIELHHRHFPQRGDRGWTPADWAWIGGLMDLAMPCLYYGVPLVAQRMRKFDPAAAWDLIARLKIRNLFLPPTALKLMRQVPVPAGVDIRSLSSGGEALGADLLQWGRETLGVEISEIYGQTECNIFICSVPGLMDAEPGFMGLPIPGADVTLMGGNDTPVATGAVGEVCVRAGHPVMFLRYWNQPDKTAEKMRGGWLRTGDLAVQDAAGRYRFVARDDDIITSAGYRIGPTEIEDCLTADPDVVMAAVVGAPDPVRTEIVVAHLVLRDGVPLDDALTERLRARVSERVSPHVAPRRFHAHDSLPLTATGKILRRALRDTPT
ncbi:AMP-binding protein [Actibacterium ureilyticum]|uniref:AMP-binding protein n=1 Tax=Actibacterium ureilyticum TaxID=1590614 RepID=UPI000BAAECEC|nr:AMP-binding protein [Actibacterium ureilyticum]